MPEQYRREFEESGQRPAVLAAIVWKHLLDIYEAEERTALKIKKLTIRYDDFTADPLATMVKVLEFCELDETPWFRTAVRAFPIHRRDSAWKEQMDPTDVSEVERVLEHHLDRYGFS